MRRRCAHSMGHGGDVATLPHSRTARPSPLCNLNRRRPGKECARGFGRRVSARLGKPTCIVQGDKTWEAQKKGLFHCRQHLCSPRSRRRRWRKTALQGLQGTRRYTNASTRLTVKFRVEKVRTCSVQRPTRPAWFLRASSRKAKMVFDVMASKRGADIASALKH